MNNLYEIEVLAKSLMNEHLDDSWSFGWNDRKRSLGVCNYRDRTVKLSREWMRKLPMKDVTDTILHEIAHAIAGPGYGHGPVWKRAAVKIGAVPSYRCSREASKAAAPDPKYVIVCPKGKIVKRYHKKPSMRVMNQLKDYYVPSRKAETIGKLKVMSYVAHQRAYA